MIIIVSSTTDEHTLAVQQQLESIGAEYHIVRLSQYPQSASLSLELSDGATNFKLQESDGEKLLSGVKSAWWRRPEGYQLHPEILDQHHQEFAMRECHEAFSGLWHSLDVHWMNNPERDATATHKVYQLKVAQDVGLSIPQTLVTSNPEHARQFIERVGDNQVIYKSFWATEHAWRETRLLSNTELEILENVKYAPVIFQEYIDADIDVRVTAVGGNIFATAIHSQDSSYKVDFRMDMQNVNVEALELPIKVQTGLRKLMDRLGLVYGAIDLRRRPDGRYVFLEINPSGQWLFLESRTQQPITEAVASELAGVS